MPQPGPDLQLALAWCDVCQRRLTSEQSRRRGRGPVCDAKLRPHRTRPRPGRRPAQVGPTLLDLLDEQPDAVTRRTK